MYKLCTIEHVSSIHQHFQRTFCCLFLVKFSVVLTYRLFARVVEMIMYNRIRVVIWCIIIVRYLATVKFSC